MLVQSADVQWEASVHAQWVSSVPCLHRLEDSTAIASVAHATMCIGHTAAEGTPTMIMVRTHIATVPAPLPCAREALEADRAPRPGIGELSRHANAGAHDTALSVNKLV